MATFLDKSYPDLSDFEKTPFEIKDETDYCFDIELPPKKSIIINNELPTFSALFALFDQVDVANLPNKSSHVIVPLFETIKLS